MGFLAQMAGLAVQNFASAAVGLVVAIALVRGFISRHQDGLGNFWVDFSRAVFRILLPLSAIFAIVLLAIWSDSKFDSPHAVHTLRWRIAKHPWWSGCESGSHQRVRYEWWWFFQR